VVFDEVQTVPGWERFIRRILDTEKVEVLISGSSAALLSREITTAMRGRAWEVVIHPFGFEEYLRHHGHAVPDRADFLPVARVFGGLFSGAHGLGRGRVRAPANGESPQSLSCGPPA
jgi:predicted AAA+ superfamily ATPase